ncbi:MAG: DNA polymerase III subunit delta [Acidobacteria bacterium]|nr:DNA polymerase III subunit delta [Acidobacteriota bacterium]
MKKQAATDPLKSQNEFYRKLRQNQFAPVYLLEGPERYLRDQALKTLREAAVDAAVRDFNYAALSVTQGDLDEALALARQFPMISPRRMVEVTGFEALNDEKQLELLKDYLRAPIDTTVLVFVSDGLDNRRNIAAMLRKGCEVVSFAPLDDRDAAPRWVSDYVARSGGLIEPAAAAYLVAMIGVDLRRLSSELDKLLTYLSGEPGKPAITKELIDQLVRYARELSNFDLTDAIVEGDRKRALILLERIFATAGEPPQTLSLFILGAIASNFRRLLLAKELMRQNAPNSEVAKAVGMSPYAVTFLNERARKFEAERLLKGIERIAQTDIALKSSLATPRLQLELLISELCPAVSTVRKISRY